MKFKFIVRRLSILTLCTLGACAPFGKQAPLEVPTAYSLPEGRSTQIAQAAWWEQLRDPNLNALVKEALQISPKLRIVKARLDQAEAELGVAQGSSKMQVSLIAQGVGIYANSKPVANQGDTDHILLTAHTALQNRWVFDFWGKNRSRIASALGRRKAIAYEAAQLRIELANAVAAQYFAWQAVVGQQKIIRQRIDIAKDSEKLLMRRVQAKILPVSAVYQSELIQQQLQIELLQLERIEKSVRYSLAALVGKTPNALADKQPGLVSSVPRLAVGNVRADLLGSRPDIAAQRSLLQAKFHNIQEAKAQFYPNIELKLLAGLAHIDAFDVVKAKSSAVVGISPALRLPIFQSRVLQSQLAVRNAQYNEQVAIYDQTVLNAMRSAADAINDYQNLQQQVAFQERIVNTAQKVEVATLRRMRAGLDNGLTHLQKRDETLKLKMKAVQTKADLAIAWSNVHAQLGGGFKM